MTIGDRIKVRRKELKITQEDVASIVKVTKQTIQKYENNIIINIPSDKIELLAKALMCSPSYIMGWDKSITLSKGETIADIANNMQTDEELFELFKTIHKMTSEQRNVVKTVVDNIK